MNLLLRASHYITRYAPSEQKLREYISKKSHTLDIGSFLKEIGYSESMMCDMWVRSFLSSSKGEREIREKLSKKGFPKVMIEEKVSESRSEIQDWETHMREIESKIDGLVKKGKSKKIIAITLIGKYPYFRDEISILLETKTDKDGIEKEIARYLSKYDITDFSDRQKFYSILQRKGFQYREIKCFLEKTEDT